MSKYLSKILIAFIVVAIFMAPISGGFKINNNQQKIIEIREVQAQDVDAGGKNDAAGTRNDTANDYSLASSCGLGFWGNSSIGGCIATILYIFWSISATLAEFGGKFLDFFIYYSTNSSSYTNEFVSNAWGAVRDIANIFFIITLLYIAIKTILGLNVTDNKKLVGAVIIIALVINFSLFTTKIVIDASNILAKVFYNNISSVDGNKKNADGTYTTETETNDGGEKSISIGIISKYNPQQIISKDVYNAEGGTSMFIFLTLILLFVTLYTAYIFFSVALLFVARVVSLWISMIFSPLAFISYAVPFDIPGFGHKEWWPDLIKNAFLAPLFIFMLYIIITFSNYLKTIAAYSNSPDMMQKLMTVIIPFAIISILLMKAKSLAVKFSGDLGTAIQGAAGAIGGLALGGGALLGGAIGRGTVGSFMKGASTGDTYANRLKEGDPTLNKFQKGLGLLQEKTGLAGWQRNVGKKLNDDQKHVQHGTHARHELDTAAGNVASGKKWNELNGEERERAKVNIERDTAKRQEGFGNKTWAQLTDEEQKKVKDRMDVNNNSTVNDFIEKSREKQGLGSSFKQSLVGGSYDIRNLSNLSIGEQDKTSNKLVTGITKGIASGLRSGLKSTLNVNYGESQKSFLKDIGHTISEALKGAKVNVNLSGLGKMETESHKGGGGHDAHGGGGHSDSHGGGDAHGGGGHDAHGGGGHGGGSHGGGH